MLFNLDLPGRKTWAGDVKQILCNLGFMHVWEQQQVGNETEFLTAFKNQLSIRLGHNWNTDIIDNKRLGTYGKFKTTLVTETYVLLNSFRLRKCLAKLRCSSHALNIEKGRHDKVPYHERVCEICKNNVGEIFIEDEYHFVCVCYVYQELRQRFLPSYITTNPDEHNFLLLMASNEPAIVRNLAIYTNEAFKLRLKILQ